MCPVNRWSVFVPEERIELGADGVWRSNGEEITHEATVAAFHRCLWRAAPTPGTHTDYELRLGSGALEERKSVHVVDTPLFVLSAEPYRPDAAAPMLSLSDGSHAPLALTTLAYSDIESGPRLTCEVACERFGGRTKARFLRAAYYQLLSELEESELAYLLGPQVLQYK